MGLNVNLCGMINAPAIVKCPKCNHDVVSRFKDYDIECGTPNPKPGVWHLDCYCGFCEHEWTLKYQIELKPA